MVRAETYRAELGIISEVSHNAIHKFKYLLTIDDCTTEDTRSEMVSQILDILDNYDIAKDDMKSIKMLMKGLR